MNRCCKMLSLSVFFRLVFVLFLSGSIPALAQENFGCRIIPPAGTKMAPPANEPQLWEKSFSEASQNAVMNYKVSGDPSEYVEVIEQLMLKGNPKAFTLIGHYSYNECFDLADKYPNYSKLLISALSKGDGRALILLNTVTLREQNHSLFNKAIELAMKSSDRKIQSIAVAYRSNVFFMGEFGLKSDRVKACSLAQTAFDLNPQNDSANLILSKCFFDKSNFTRAFFHISLVVANSKLVASMKEEYRESLSDNDIKRMHSYYLQD